ncbi:MAG: S1C family serine protease [Planctomycetota bacterium]
MTSRVWTDRTRFLFLVTWSLLISLSGLSAVIRAQEPAATAATGAAPATVVNDEATRLIAQQARPCTVGINSQKDRNSFFGTGAIISPNGYILTSTTVVPTGATAIEVTFTDFVSRSATLVETNEALETALIKVEAEGLPSLSLARDLPAVGSTAYTLSNANNFLSINGQPSFSRGTVSGVYPVENWGGESLYAGVAIETTAAVNPGSDGGPILNSAGQLCGLISLNISPRRWQGLAVPTKILLDKLESLKAGKVAVKYDPLAGLPPAATQLDPVAQKAADVARHLVSISVRRKYPEEVLLRTPWEQVVQQIPKFAELKDEEKGKRLQSYFEALRLFEANQILRRPKGVLTGLLISADGHIVTSQFNVGEDVAFLDKGTNAVRVFDLKDPLKQLLEPPAKGYERVANPIEKLVVKLADGRELEARVVSRHVPLGVVVLKIEAADLPFFDLQANSTVPELGAPLGILGVVSDSETRYTLNPGMVSATQRNRGFQFQTDALVNYGNSGGPIIDAEGRFMGLADVALGPATVMGRLFQDQELNSWQTAPNSGVSLVARGDRLRESLEELKSGKSILQPPGAFLGIGPDQRKLFSTEVTIGAVTPKSPADQAGLKVGDRILSINNEELNNWRDMLAHLANFKPGDQVEIKVFRPRIVEKLMIGDQEIKNEDDLKKIKAALKPNEKFEGRLVVEDTRTVKVTLGERQ